MINAASQKLVAAFLLVIITVMFAFTTSVVFADIATTQRGNPTGACKAGSMKYGGGKLFFCYTSNAYKTYSSVR